MCRLRRLTFLAHPVDYLLTYSSFDLISATRVSWARARVTPAVDITAVTSSGHVTASVTSPIDSAWPISYRLPIVNKQPPIYRSFRDVHAHATHQTPPRYTPQPWAGGPATEVNQQRGDDRHSLSLRVRPKVHWARRRTT